MIIDLPNVEEMAKVEASIPVKIPDLSPGSFKGFIEEIDIFESDEPGVPDTDTLRLNIRVLETGNGEHIGQLMQHYLNLKTKPKNGRKGRVIPASYKFLCALQPEIRTGKGLNTEQLCLTEFAAEVEYNGAYWNYQNVEFIKRHEDFGF